MRFFKKAWNKITGVVGGTKTGVDFVTRVVKSESHTQFCSLDTK